MKNTDEKLSRGENGAAAKQKYASSFLFSGIPSEEAESLVDLLSFELKEFKRGDTVVCHGSCIPCLGVIVSGKAIVCRSGAGRRLILRHMEEGAFFGVSSLFGGESFPTDIIADSECIVATSTEADVEALLTAEPRAAMNYIRFLSGKIRFLNDSIDSYSIRSTDEKIAKFLLRLCPEGKGRVASYTRAADSLGMGRASLYRSLDGLEKSGVILRRGADITLCDADALRALAEGKPRRKNEN